MEQSDEDMMLEHQSGHKGAMEVIFTRYKNRIFNFCLRFLGNRADAEDVTGDVFLSLLTEKYTPQPQAKFSTWLFTIARNKCVSRIRQGRPAISLWFTSKEDGTEQMIDIPDHKSSTRENLNDAEMSVVVKGAILKLPMEQKEAIILREYHEFSYQEISQILNCSVEKVKVLIFRGREELRVQLGSFLKEEGHG